MDAGALDEVDLDDMFTGDGDLFEGLDIELEGMGDIMKEEKKDQTKKAPKRTGPKTKRSNPMLEAAAEEEAANASGSKRRKTKRKSKTPIAFGDDDDDYTDDAALPPRKKTRKAASAAKKGKATPTPAAAQSKRKKKKDSSGASIPSPSKLKKSGMQGIPRGPSGIVAAAGQFGGRAKRGSATLGSTKGTKRKLKGAVSSSFMGLDGTGSPFVAEAKPPKPESTYSGIKPSSGLFYPFLEAIPPEPSMKPRKMFPIFDRILSSYNGALNAVSTPTPPEDTYPVPHDAAVVQLLAEVYDAASDKERASFTPEKRSILVASIPQLRKTIQGYDKAKIVADLHSFCGLLTRQHNFLKQSLDNMQSWCQKEFTSEDYQSTFFQPEPTIPNYLDALRAKWKNPNVRVKLVCPGFKEPKGAPELMAILPSYAVPPQSLKAASATSKKKKKDKAGDSKTAATPTKPGISVPKTYSNCPAVERRQRIIDKVARYALELETNMQQKTSTANVKKGMSNKLEAPPVEEPLLHTSRMWEWLENAGFYKAPTVETNLMQSPEINPRGIFLPVPAKIQGSQETDTEISSNSLVDRLQSLLVQVDGSDSDESSIDYSSDELIAETSEDEESVISATKENGNANDVPMVDVEDAAETDPSGKWNRSKIDDTSNDSDSDDISVADVSALTLEERTFLHLRIAGVIQPSLFPKVELALNSVNENGKVASSNVSEAAEDDLVNVIGEMAKDLSDLTSKNNGRLSFLDAAVTKLDLPHQKQREDEQASIHSRCQALLKRSKEKAKKANKQKKDDLNLPW